MSDPDVQPSGSRLGNPWLTSVTPKWNTLPVPFPDNALDWVKEADFQPPFPRMISYAADFNTPMSHQWNITADREIHRGVTATLGLLHHHEGRVLLDVEAFERVGDEQQFHGLAEVSSRRRGRAFRG